MRFTHIYITRTTEINNPKFYHDRRCCAWTMKCHR